MKSIILAGWLLAVSGLATTAVVFSPATGAHDFTCATSKPGNSVGERAALGSGAISALRSSIGDMNVRPALNPPRPAQVALIAPLNGAQSVGAGKLPTDKWAFWLEVSLAATAGVFCALWLNRQMMAGIPEDCSANVSSKASRPSFHGAAHAHTH
ncbi:MAG: hypothetical protein RLY20_3562 [Verrucomicrobiota bacterium]